MQAEHTSLRTQRIEDRDNESEQLTTHHDDQPQDSEASGSATNALTNWNNARPRSFTPGSSSNSIAESFGYFEYSERSTIALIRKVSRLHGNRSIRHSSNQHWYKQLGLESGEHHGNQDVTREASLEVEQQMKRLPDRQICDFLVQYYIDEIHW